MAALDIHRVATEVVTRVATEHGLGVATCEGAAHNVAVDVAQHAVNVGLGESDVRARVLASVVGTLGRAGWLERDRATDVQITTKGDRATALNVDVVTYVNGALYDTATFGTRGLPSNTLAHGESYASVIRSQARRAYRDQVICQTLRWYV